MMTRLAFLWKVLAFGWVGQAAHTTNIFECGRAKTTQVFAQDLNEKDCAVVEPKLGESRCPIGHCQKPRVVKLQPLYEVPCMKYHADGTLADDGLPCGVAGGPPFTQHVCSTCGIVYVPISHANDMGATNEISE